MLQCHLLLEKTHERKPSIASRSVINVDDLTVLYSVSLATTSGRHMRLWFRGQGH
jgi:hypothetical protein